MRRTLGPFLRCIVPTDVPSTPSDACEEVVDLKHRQETPCKYPPLQSECSSHHSFISQELGVGVDLKLPVDTSPVGRVSGWSGDLSW